MNDDLFHEDDFETGETIESWVQDKSDTWRNYYDSNYKLKFEEYQRIWLGTWAAEDRTRESERSRLISPATSQAIEENTAEVEEATFGRGDWFDIRDDVADQNPEDVALLRTKLHEDLAFTRTKSVVSECILNAAVYGTGIGEIVMDEIVEQVPATEEALGGDLVSVGVNVRKRTVAKLRSILPQNCLADPNGSSVDDGLGIIIDEFVGREYVEQLQESGSYRSDVSVGTASPDDALEPTQDLTMYQDDRVRLTRYYGLVPRHLLDEAQKEEMEADLEMGSFGNEEEEDDTYLVEAIVVLGNGHLLKAEANPYMMQDRPVIAFQWDVVPGRFFGRGVTEKAYNSQKALDAEIRGRVDALALTIHPMMGVDATRMPRGSRPSIAPGKMIKTNGNPREILSPFTFGQVDQITFAQAEALQKMVQQATGAINAAGMPNAAAQGGAAAGAISMSLGAVLKRHKRTLMQFQSNFLIPLIQKMAHRYMQFDPENYPVGDYKFNVNGSLGTVAREYETGQMTQLMQTVPPDSPAYQILLKATVENMQLSQREKLLAAIDQANEPNPEAQQAAQEAQAKEIAVQDAQIALLNGQANESNARAAKYAEETKAIPEEMEIDRIKAATTNLRDGENDDKEFDRRLRVLSELREERKLSASEKMAENTINQTTNDTRRMDTEEAEKNELEQLLAQETEAQDQLDSVLGPSS